MRFAWSGDGGCGRSAVRDVGWDSVPTDPLTKSQNKPPDETTPATVRLEAKTVGTESPPTAILSNFALHLDTVGGLLVETALSLLREAASSAGRSHRSH